jgi:uncharacterized Fe-S cluster-containing radical SAM superfamily protein
MTIPYLEMPITHICSLHCDGCSAYSNYNLKKTVALADARQWMREWSTRVTPGHFRVLGGEPFLHPHLPEIMLSVRQFWPDCHIQVCTNGLNIDRHPMVPFILSQPNTSLSLSLHSRDEDYLIRINAAIATINTWVADFGVKAQLGDNIVKWNRFYQGIGRNMTPFEGEAAASWKVCHSQHCCNLIENRLWKCPQIGNLHIVAEKFDLHENPLWTQYLAYQGIGPEATDDELRNWLRARAGPEAVCQMCPTQLENYEKDIYNVNYDLPDVFRYERPATRLHR